MKIAVIGAGSYVFGPSVLAQTYLEQGLPDVHLALVDPDLETVELLAAVGRRMARERGLATISNHVPNRYVLSFQPQMPQPGLHAITVTLKDHPDLVVTARSSYWAGDAATGPQP